MSKYNRHLLMYTYVRIILNTYLKPKSFTRHTFYVVNIQRKIDVASSTFRLYRLLVIIRFTGKITL